MVTKISLPSEILKELDIFAAKLLKNPNVYILNGAYNAASRPAHNVDDPNLPILSDEFILNHDLNSTTLDRETSLETCAYKWLYDVAYPPAGLMIRCIEYLEQQLSKTFIAYRGNFLYPPRGYMGWHTNSDVPGTRVYLAYAPKGGISSFKWVDRWSSDTPKVITDYDETGWTARMFYPSDVPAEYLWHCVDSPSNFRLSYGLLFK